MKDIETILDICILIVSICWFVNLYNLVNGCDFESPYTCEISHGIGIVFAPASVITAFIDTDIDK